VVAVWVGGTLSDGLGTEVPPAGSEAAKVVYRHKREDGLDAAARSSPVTEIIFLQKKTRQFMLISFITARCTLVQSAVLRSHVVCLSVCPSVRPSVRL